MRYLSLICLSLITSPLVYADYNETGEALYNQENSYPEYTQSTSDNGHWWFNLGVGAGSTISDAHLAAAAHLSFNGRLSPHTYIGVSSNSFGSDYNQYEGHDIGVLYGYVNRKPNWYYAGALGVAYYRVEKDINYWWQDTKRVQGVGLPLEVQTFWTPFRHFGVGVIGHGLIGEKPYLSAYLAVQVYG